MRVNVKKNRIFLTAIRVIAIVFVVGIGVGVYKTFQPLYQCNVIVHTSIPSPDSSRLAVVHEMGCGATAEFNTQVSIAPANQPFSPDKNPSFLSIHGQHDLAIKWLSHNAIEIELPKAEPIYKSELRVGDVTSNTGSRQIYSGGSRANEAWETTDRIRWPSDGVAPCQSNA